MSRIFIIAAAAVVVAATSASALVDQVRNPSEDFETIPRCEPFASGQGSACNPFSLHWTGAKARYVPVSALFDTLCISPRAAA